MTLPSPKHRPVNDRTATGSVSSSHGRSGRSLVLEAVTRQAPWESTLSPEKITTTISRLFERNVVSVSPWGPHFVLSLHRHEALFLKRIRYADSARHECEIMQFLQDQGFKHAVFPLKSIEHRYVFHIDAEKYFLFPYVVARPRRCWQRVEMQAAGQVVGQLHECLRDMPLYREGVETRMFQGTFLRDLYHDAYAAIGEWSTMNAQRKKTLEGALDVFASAGMNLPAILDSLSWDSLHKQYIHGDLHQDNCLFTEEGEILIIDFEYSLYAPPAMDLAYMLWGILDSNFHGDWSGAMDVQRLSQEYSQLGSFPDRCMLERMLAVKYLTMMPTFIALMLSDFTRERLAGLNSAITVYRKIQEKWPILRT